MIVFRSPLLAVVLTVLAIPMMGQNHLYDFDDFDVSDAIGAADGAASNVSFVGGVDPFVEVDEGSGIITLPSSVNAGLVSASNFAISFELQITSGAPCAVLAAVVETPGVFWEESPGFSIYALDAWDGGYLSFNFGDQGSFGNVGLNALPQDTWISVELLVDFESGFYRFTADDQVALGNFPVGFDVAEFQAAISSSLFTVGGFNGLKPIPWTGWLAFDDISISYPISSTEDVQTAYYWLYQDLVGNVNLSSAQEELYLNTVRYQLPFAEYGAIADTLFWYTDMYEALNNPVFEENAINPVMEETLPVHDQALLYSQEYVFESRFTPEHVASTSGIRFEFADLFPGAVPDATPRLSGEDVELDCTYHTDIAAEYGMQEFVVRPMGLYVAPGDVVTVEVPLALQDAGLAVIVGAHFRNMIPGPVNRPRDVSLEFPINGATTTVANPYGGGLYLKVPDGTDLGWQTATVNGAVMSPYFSWRAGRETEVADWLAAMAESGAPWVDFESDKYMFTIPISNAAATTVPDLVMTQWDALMDDYRRAGGRPTDTRIRAEYYTADRKLVTPAYGSGYPTVITLPELNFDDSNWDPIQVLNAPPSPILLHEMGHTAMHPTLEYDVDNPCNFEAETIVHVPACLIHENVYGMTPDTAFAKSSVTPGTLGFDEVAFDWMMSSNFRNNVPMSIDPEAPMDDKDQLKYQQRGWAKYPEIARLFGWEVMEAIFANWYSEGVQQVSTVSCNPAFQNIIGREDFIQFACNESGFNMAPLLHFWGIHPSLELATALSGLPKSQVIKAQLEHYRCHVSPSDISEYEFWHNRVYDEMGYQQPRFDLYLASFNADMADELDAQFDLILTTYGLVGPDAPVLTSVEGTGDGLAAYLTWDDTSDNEVGFAIGYRVAETTAPFILLGTTGPDITSWTSPSITAGTFEFRVVALGADGLESDHCAANLWVETLAPCDPGCMDVEACNYNPLATCEDGSCEYTSCTCPEDLDGNGQIGTGDVLMVIADFGCSTPVCAGDLDGDLATGSGDLLMVLALFGSICP